MKIAYIAAGAAGMYCGSCLRDNALANALVEAGEDVTLVPIYTPLRVDERTISEERVFFGAVEVFLHEKLPFLRRKRGLLRKILGSRALLSWVSRFSLSTNPGQLGRLTVSTLRGESGSQHRLLTELIDWLTRDVQPDLVHLSNSLLSGFARELKRRLRIPVVCSFQGEGLFINGLPEPHRARAIGLIRERSADIDAYTASSIHEADSMASLIGLDRSRISVVLPGIQLTSYEGLPASRPAGSHADAPPVIGYLARIAPEKGLHLLCHAFQILWRTGEFPGIKLKAAGYLAGKDLAYAAGIRRQLALSGIRDEVEIIGTVDRDAKLAFFREIDVLAVPTTFPEPKGIFVLEALASGVPVVEPRHGSFPELLDATGGGLLHEPGSAEDLAGKLGELLRNPELRAELGARGREAVQARFSSRRMAEDVMAVYRKLVPNKGDSH